MSDLIKISTEVFNELGKPAKTILTFTEKRNHKIEFEVDERKYPDFWRQKKDVLLEHGYIVLACGWNEVDCYHWIVVK